MIVSNSDLSPVYGGGCNHYWEAGCSWSLSGNTLSLSVNKHWNASSAKTVTAAPPSGCSFQVIRLNTSISGTCGAVSESRSCSNSDLCTTTSRVCVYGQYTCTAQSFCTLEYAITCGDSVPVPPCTTPQPVQDDRCVNNNGLWVYGLSSDHANELFFRDGSYIEYGFNSTPPYRIDQNGNIIEWNCQPMESPTGVWVGGMPQIFSGITCPDGFIDESSSSSNNGVSSSSVDGNSSSSTNNSSSSRSNICDLFPGTVLCPSASSSNSTNPDDNYNPNYDWCDDNPDSFICIGYGSSASTNNSSSASSAPSLCDEFPFLSWCQENGGSFSSGSVGSAGSGGGSSGGSNGGGNNGSNGSSGSSIGCKDLRDCDWAKWDVQLTQLGVERETRDSIKIIAELLRNGYNLSKTQTLLLQGIHDSLATRSLANDKNAKDIIEAINNLGASLSGGSSGSGDGSSGGSGNGGSSGSGDGSSSGSSNSSSSGSENGKPFGEINFDSLANSLSNAIGGDSFQDHSFTGLQAKEMIENSFTKPSAISDSITSKGNAFSKKMDVAMKPFKDYIGTTAQCKINLTFNTGVMGIGCPDPSKCVIDLHNIFGIDVVSFINSAIMLLAVLGSARLVLNALAGFKEGL